MKNTNTPEKEKEIITLLALSIIDRITVYTAETIIYFLRIPPDKIRGMSIRNGLFLVEVHLYSKRTTVKRPLRIIGNGCFLELKDILEFKIEDIKKIIPC